MSFNSALPATLLRFQTIGASKSSLDVASGREYETLLIKELVDIATSHDTHTLIRRHADSGVGYDTYVLIRRHMDRGVGHDGQFSKFQPIWESRSSLDVASGHEYATLLIKAVADVATPHDTYMLTRLHVDRGGGYDVYALIRRHVDSGVGYSSETLLSSKRREGCVVTNAVYGGLRICYKKEGDLLDFETLWYIFLTLRRVDEFIQEISEINIIALPRPRAWWRQRTR